MEKFLIFASKKKKQKKIFYDYDDSGQLFDCML